jgi:hypothetical protein
MNSIVLYYSYTGHTKKIAEKMAHTQSCELVEIQTQKRRSKLTVFLLECPRARMRKAASIKPIDKDLSGYDMITLAAPVWNSFPAPAFNAMVELLPKDKHVEIILVSGHGSGATAKSEEGTRKMIKKKGCTIVAYKEIKQPV